MVVVAEMNLEITCTDTGTFLGYHGRELPLRSGWLAWNARSDGRLVGSLVVSVGPPDHLDWDEADYAGPFFLEHTGGDIAVFHCAYIDPELRGGGLWREFERILGWLGLPVYAPFANPRLHHRFERLHRPAAAPVPVA